MDSKLIVMLTHNDHTVTNAFDVFNNCKDLAVEHWGFKNVGLPMEKMHDLLAAMKEAGKTTVLEVVTYTEESCLSSAKMAVNYGFDYFTGSLFFDSVWDYLKAEKIKYFPFIGNVGGSPVELRGNIDEIVEEGRKLESLGVYGLDLVAYRYIEGDPINLARQVVCGVKNHVILAGSISDEERIRNVRDINPFAFTMGSALFDGKFAPGDFRANLKKVIQIMQQL